MVKVCHSIEFAKDTLNGGKYQDNDFSNTSKLKVIDMLGHDCSEAALVVPHAELVVDPARDKPAFIGHFAKLHGKGTWSITKASTWLVTM